MRVRACPKAHEDIVKMGKKRNPMNHVSACIKTDALKKVGKVMDADKVQAKIKAKYDL